MVVKEHQPLAELVRWMDLKRYAPIRDRIRAVVLAMQGQDAPQIARTLDRHFRWVQRWVYRYRDEGLGGSDGSATAGSADPTDGRSASRV